MNTPDLELLHAFGNEDVYADKIAGRADLLARVALGLLGYGVGRMALSRTAGNQAQAEAVDDAFERMQRIQLQQAEQGARHTRPPIVIPVNSPGMRRWDGDAVPVGMDEGMVRLAHVAYSVGADMAKEALSIPSGLGDAAKGLFGAAKGILGGGAPSVGKVMGAAAQAPKMPTLAAAAQKITGGLQAAPKPPPGVGQAASTLAGGLMGSLGGVGAKIQKGLQQSGIKTPGDALRTAGGLALGGAAIKGGVSALKGGLNVMGREAPPAQFGSVQQGGSRVANGINEYGQPDLRTPFM